MGQIDDAAVVGGCIEQRAIGVGDRFAGKERQVAHGFGDERFGGLKRKQMPATRAPDPSHHPQRVGGNRLGQAEPLQAAHDDYGQVACRAGGIGELNFNVR